MKALSILADMCLLVFGGFAVFTGQTLFDICIGLICLALVREPSA